MEDAGATCSLDIEVDATTTLRTTYSYTGDLNIGNACNLAEILSGMAVTRMLNVTS